MDSIADPAKHRRGTFGAALIVDDDAHEREGVLRWARAQGLFSRVDTAGSPSEALQRLDASYAVVLVEALFRDGTTCRDFVRIVLQMRSPPMVVAMSSRAGRQLIAELMLSGVEAYLEKPFQDDQLLGQLARAQDELYLCRRLARALVGRVGLKEAQWYVRGLMNREALARAGGNRRAAASLLRIDRRYVARLADEFRNAKFEPEH